jgi:hypothetical protein
MTKYGTIYAVLLGLTKTEEHGELPLTTTRQCH